eukprot:10991103-Alexandrium_andersonii.AAC.1
MAKISLRRGATRTTPITPTQTLNTNTNANTNTNSNNNKTNNTNNTNTNRPNWAKGCKHFRRHLRSRLRPQ